MNINKSTLDEIEKYAAMHGLDAAYQYITMLLFLEAKSRDETNTSIARRLGIKRTTLIERIRRYRTDNTSSV